MMLATALAVPTAVAGVEITEPIAAVMGSRGARTHQAGAHPHTYATGYAKRKPALPPPISHEIGDRTDQAFLLNCCWLC